MKRLICTFLILCLALVAGCGEKTEPAVTAQPETQASTVTTQAPTEAPPETTSPVLPTTQPPATTEALPPPTTQPPAVEEGFTAYFEKIPRASQPIFREPSYDGQYVGTVMEAGIYTIVEERWDDEYNLWGKLKSGAGWVDLTDIRSPDCPIAIGFTKDAPPEGDYLLYTGDTSEYAVSLILRPDFPVRDVLLTDVDMSEGYPYSGNILFSATYLSAQLPLVTEVSFPGDMSCYFLFCTDEEGYGHSYLFSLSMRNGLPQIWEWNE